ncbi:vitamin B12 dependent-methionine synthase activation domain-containing protein [Escherichia coli]
MINVQPPYHEQTEKTGFANYCLADFVAPKLSGKADYIGAFAVTGGLEEDALADAFEAQHDDYNKIMVKALADRLAEAFAEYLHERVRKVYWGYAPNENLSNEELIRRKLPGASITGTGLPGLPGTYGKSHHLGAAGEYGKTYRHETHRIFRHVARCIGFGWFFSHPDSKYYAVAQIQRDQVEDYAAGGRF